MGARSLVWTLVVASIAMAGCGASLRRAHRASAYFEECYAADLDRAVPDAERRACWQAWSRSYLVGASAERLDYVHERLAMLDPDRAAAIALATGDDGSIEQLDTPETNDAASLYAQSTLETPPTEPTSTEIVGGAQDTTDVAADLAPTITATPVAVNEPMVTPLRTPMPSEVAPTDTTIARTATDARHARTHERHLHRGIVAPASDTPRCPCEAGWQTCSAGCLADDHGCIGACRSDFRICSRSCY